MIHQFVVVVLHPSFFDVADNAAQEWIESLVTALGQKKECCTPQHILRSMYQPQTEHDQCGTSVVVVAPADDYAHASEDSVLSGLACALLRGRSQIA